MSRILLLLPTATYRARAFLEAASALGVDVVNACERPNALLGRKAEGYLTLDFEDPERAGEEVGRLARERPLHGVVPVDEATAVVAAHVGARLGVPHNPVEAARAARDKLLFRRRLASAGLPGPEFLTVDLDEGDLCEAVEAALPPPWVVKPRHLSGSRGVQRADNREELERAFQVLREILAESEAPADDPSLARSALVESYLEGPEVSVEGLLSGGRLRFLALLDKPDTPAGPTFEETLLLTPSLHPPHLQEEIRNSVGRGVEALGLVEGPLHAELRLTDRGPVLLEVAARSIGGRCSRILRFAGGDSLESLILKAALGEDPGVVEREEAAVGVLMLPVPRSGRFLRVGGAERVEAVEGIERLEITSHPGQELRALPWGDRYVGFLYARGADRRQVESALRDAWALLDVEMEIPPA